MRALPLAVLLALAALAHAQEGRRSLLGIDLDPGWAEQEVKPPALPQEQNLVAFAVSAATANRFFLDAQSIATGADGVVRYTLVVRSQSGAENVSFEGMRCATGEIKRYAFARKDGTWSPARSPQWSPIRQQEINNQHGVLYNNFLCDLGKPAGTPEAIVKSFKFPRARRALD